MQWGKSSSLHLRWKLLQGNSMSLHYLHSVLLLSVWCYMQHRHTVLRPFFPGLRGWASARIELLDFIVQGKTNRGRHTDHPAGHYSIRTNQCPPPPSPHLLQAWSVGLSITKWALLAVRDGHKVCCFSTKLHFLWIGCISYKLTTMTRLLHDCFFRMNLSHTLPLGYLSFRTF